MKRLPALIFVTLLILLTIEMAAQERERWVVPRINTEIVLDGMPDEAVWDQVSPFPMVTHFPVSGDTPTEKSV
ncbi:MAG: hypothetical protein KAT15_01520, partial [Bacteroidales bacterium]|nr:hypothetical protein [Bacteroidales bacterium]